MTQLRQYRDRLWLTELSLPQFEVRGAVLNGPSTVVWDTLSHPRDMRPLVEIVGPQSPIVVYSHADWDHAWGTAGLASVEWVVGHDSCRNRFDEDVPATLDEKRSSEPGDWGEVALIPPNLTFPTELSFNLGDVTLTLHHLPGHTRDCIVGFLPEWGILLAGDTVESPFPVVNPGSPIEEWMRLLRRWLGEPRLETVIPAHGPISGPGLIQSNLEYLEGLLAGVGPAVPPEWPDFYRQTHQTNLELARRHREKRGT